EGVPCLTGALEEGRRGAGLWATRAPRNEPALLVAGIAGHLRPPQIEVADDIGFRDLVEPLRTEVRHEVRDDLSVTVLRRLLRRVRGSIHGPPVREARDRALPSVNPGPDVVLDLARAPLCRLLVRDPGGLVEQLTVHRLPEVPDPASLPQSHCAPPCSSSDQEPVDRIE